MKKTILGTLALALLSAGPIFAEQQCFTPEHAPTVGKEFGKCLPTLKFSVDEHSLELFRTKHWIASVHKDQRTAGEVIVMPVNNEALKTYEGLVKTGAGEEIAQIHRLVQLAVIQAFHMGENKDFEIFKEKAELVLVNSYLRQVVDHGDMSKDPTVDKRTFILNLIPRYERPVEIIVGKQKVTMDDSKKYGRTFNENNPAYTHEITNPLLKARLSLKIRSMLMESLKGIETFQTLNKQQYLELVNPKDPGEVPDTFIKENNREGGLVVCDPTPNDNEVDYVSFNFDYRSNGADYHNGSRMMMGQGKKRDPNIISVKDENLSVLFSYVQRFQTEIVLPYMNKRRAAESAFMLSQGYGPFPLYKPYDIVSQFNLLMNLAKPGETDLHYHLLTFHRDHYFANRPFVFNTGIYPYVPSQFTHEQRQQLALDIVEKVIKPLGGSVEWHRGQFTRDAYIAACEKEGVKPIISM